MLDSLLDILRKEHGILAYALVFCAAFSEYIVPPFPGDTVALFAIFLAAQAELNAGLVYAVMTGGAVVGGVLAWGVGVWLADREDRWPARFRRPRMQASLDAVRRGYARYGAAYLLLNRFLPAFRAFFFVGAGLSRMPLLRVVVYGGISAAVWNALLLGVGYGLGRNWETLLSLFEQYALASFIMATLVLLVWWLRFRRSYTSGGST